MVCVKIVYQQNWLSNSRVTCKVKKKKNIYLKKIPDYGYGTEMQT